MTSGCIDCPLRTLFTLVAEQSYCSFSCSTTSGFYASYSSIARWLVSSSDRIYLPPRDPFDCGAMASSAVSSAYTCVMLLEIMLKHVQLHTSTTEMQRVSTNGNFAQDFASLVKLMTNTSKHCPKSETDNVVMHSSLHKELAS